MLVILPPYPSLNIERPCDDWAVSKVFSGREVIGIAPGDCDMAWDGSTDGTSSLRE